MSKLFSFVFLLLISLLFIVLQSTVLSPRQLGVFHPDLNLILIIFLALFSEVKGSAIIAVGNGYMMDILSGYLLGIYTLSRFSVFAMLQGFSMSVYSQSGLIQGVAIFLGTLFSWTFMWAAFKIKSDFEFDVSFGTVILQCVVNTLIGIPLFWVIKRFHARI